MNPSLCIFFLAVLLFLPHHVAATDFQCFVTGESLARGTCFSVCSTPNIPQETYLGRTFRNFIIENMDITYVRNFMNLTVYYSNGTIDTPYFAVSNIFFQTDEIKPTNVRVKRVDFCHLSSGTQDTIPLDFYSTISYIGTVELAVIGSFAGIHFVLAIICIVFLILLIVFSRKQPLRSRGGLPIVNLLFLLVKMGCAEILNWLSFEFRDFEPICFILFMALMHVFSQFMLLSNHLRYLILVRMTRSQVFLIKHKNPGLRVLIRFLKVINSIYFFLFIQTLIFLTLVLAPFVATFASIPDSCPAEIPGLPFLGVAALFYILNVILYLSIGGLDLMCNIQQSEKWTLKSFMVTSDPHSFRIEFLCYLFHPIFILITVVLIMAVTGVFAEIGNYTDVILYGITSSILLPDFYIIIVMVGFPLLLTIIRMCKNRNAPKTNDLEEILRDEDARASFKKYSESEFSVENVLCFDDIAEYKKTPSVEKAKQIYENYLAMSAPVEVNIQRKTADAVFAKFTTGETPEDLFSAIERDLVVNMSDTFSRYALTPEFGIHFKKKELIEKI